MNTVKTYKGHDVPEGATHYGPEAEGWFECFYKFDFAETSTCIAGESEWVDASSLFTRTDIVELPKEPETFVPVVGEEYALSGNRESGGGKCGLVVNFPERAGEEVRVYSEFTDDRGSRMYAYLSVDAVNRFGGVGGVQMFNPIKSEREKIKEWVESKIDCVESFQMDQAIMISLMLDLGCLVIPEPDK